MSTAFIGLDLAKSVFQVHGVDAQGKVVVTKRLRRDTVLAFFANLAPCVIGMEACAGSHFRARELTRLGHTVRLMAPQYVKPYQPVDKLTKPLRVYDIWSIGAELAPIYCAFIALIRVYQRTVT